MTHGDQSYGVGPLLASEVSLLSILFFLGAQRRWLADQGGKLLGFGDSNLLLAPHSPKAATDHVQASPGSISTITHRMARTAWTVVAYIPTAEQSYRHT